jgi:hypothetical protein
MLMERIGTDASTTKTPAPRGQSMFLKLYQLRRERDEPASPQASAPASTPRRQRMPLKLHQSRVAQGAHWRSSGSGLVRRGREEPALPQAGAVATGATMAEQAPAGGSDQSEQLQQQQRVNEPQEEREEQEEVEEEEEEEAQQQQQTAQQEEAAKVALGQGGMTQRHRVPHTAQLSGQLLGGLENILRQVRRSLSRLYIIIRTVAVTEIPMRIRQFRSRFLS